jgi:hypothetical protein
VAKLVNAYGFAECGFANVAHAIKDLLAGELLAKAAKENKLQAVPVESRPRSSQVLFQGCDSGRAQRRRSTQFDNPNIRTRSSVCFLTDLVIPVMPPCLMPEFVGWHSVARP